MIILQTKYCKTNEELNEFLATLHSDLSSKGFPRFHSISFIPKMHSIYRRNPSIQTDVVAVVLYYDDIEKE